MASKPSTTVVPLDDDAINPKFAASALDFLLIELIPLAQRITEQLHAREQALIDEYKRSRIFHKSQPSARKTAASPTTQIQDAKRESGVPSEPAAVASAKESTVAEGDDAETSTVITSLGFPVMDEETREGVFFRLDGLGYRVGQGLVER